MNIAVAVLNLCPNCGSELKVPNKLNVDLRSNTVSVNGNSEKVAPRLAEILYVLAQHAPGKIKCEDLRSKVYGMQDPPGESAIRVQISTARRVGDRIGFRIESSHSGYRLIVTNFAEAKHGRI